jgi:hypothetical protein
VAAVCSQPTAGFPGCCPQQPAAVLRSGGQQHHKHCCLVQTMGHWLCHIRPSACDESCCCFCCCCCHPQAAEMMRNMSPEEMAAMSRQAGHPLDAAAIADAQRQMASMSPDTMAAMAKLAAMGPQARESPAAMAQAAEVRCSQLLYKLDFCHCEPVRRCSCSARTMYGDDAFACCSLDVLPCTCTSP